MREELTTFEDEIWKDVEGFKKSYQISNCGRVRTLTRLIEEPRRKYIREGKMMNQYSDSRGYYKVKLYRGDASFKSMSVHRLVAVHFIPNPENLPQINHIDGDPGNNHYTNLEWCTISQNTKHTYSTGLKRKENYTGEANNWAKLKEQDVLNIRKEREQGASLKELAEKYNTRVGNISFIINRQTWKYV